MLTSCCLILADKITVPNIQHDVRTVLPIISTVSYGGHKLCIMPLLPLEKFKAELVCGSSDGGNTVHNSDGAVCVLSCVELRYRVFHA